ncbi:MAG: dihydrofolate reductase [Rhodospirillales bacterium]|nr:dihydrofolate reductase [Rhodospirillales bacterium]
MAKFVFEMNMSLDGYTDHESLGTPDPVLFSYFIELTRNTTGAIYGRGLYEAMRYWDGDDWDQDDSRMGSDLRAFAEAWRAMPKWVVSRSLKSVGPNSTLLNNDVEAAIRKLKIDLDGEVEVGGPKLAASLTALGLIDEYRLLVHPVALGGGRPFFVGPGPRLQLTASDRIGADVIRLIYVPA